MDKKDIGTNVANIMLASAVITIWCTSVGFKATEAVVQASVDAETTTVEVVEVIEEKAEPLTPERVESIIREIATEHNFQWPDYLVRLAKCESGLRADAVNTQGNVPSDSVDRGVFQINNYHHSEVSDKVAFDLTLATEWTMWRINTGYQHEWTCDSLIKN